MEGKKIEYPKLPKVFKRRWVKALRSGEYKKGQGTLKDDGNRYCCLGVACAMEGIKIPPNVPLIERGLKGIRKIPSMLIITSEVNSTVDELVGLNDSRNWSFKKIADWIEENL